MARRILMSSVTAGGLGWLCTKYTVVTYKWRTVVQQHVTIKKKKNLHLWRLALTFMSPALMKRDPSSQIRKEFVIYFVL